MSASCAGDRAWTWFRSLLVGLVVCRGLVYLCIMPPFEGWDEFEHLGYIVHVLETGRPAVLGETNVPGSLLGPMIAFPQPKSVVELQLGRLGAVDYAAYWKPEVRPVLRSGAMELYQAQHSWWYYRLVAPLFQALGGVDDLRLSVGGLRLLNVAFAAAAVWVALGAVGRLVVRKRDAALIGLVIAVHPLFLINAARVSSDAPGVFLATVAVAGCLSLRSPQLLPRCAGVGFTTGLSILAKAVNLGLVPFVAWNWLTVVVRDRLRLRTALLAALILGSGCLAVTQADWRANLSRYGLLTPMQEAVVNRSRGRTASDLLRTASHFRWERQARRLWLRDTFFFGGWSNVRPAPASIGAYSVLVLIGLTGYAAAGLAGGRRNEPVFVSSSVPVGCAVLCLSFTVALGYHMVQSKLAWGQSTTGPWYASSAVPWFLVLVAGGGLSWPLGRLRLAVPTSLAMICLATEWSVAFGQMLATYSGGASGGAALRRIAALQPSMLGTSTLVTAAVGQAVVVSALVVLWNAVWSEDVEPDEPARRNSEPALNRPHVAVSNTSSNPI